MALAFFPPQAFAQPTPSYTLPEWVDSSGKLFTPGFSYDHNRIDIHSSSRCSEGEWNCALHLVAL